MARRRPAPRNLIPEPITRILALHGALHIASGLANNRVSVLAHGAPFDDMLVLFLPRRSPFRAALDRDPRVELNVQGGENNYVVRIQGRAIDTGPASGHERRMEIVPWLPEGATLNQFLAVELIPERIEYAYDEGEERRYFQGTTAAAKTPTMLARWLDLCFRGVLPALVLSFVSLWVYVGWWGEWFPLQPLALATSLVGCVGLLAAARLCYRVLAHRRWQRGKAARHFGGLLSEGLLPVRSAAMAAGGLSLLACVALVLCGVGWGGELFGVALAATQLWFLLPLWAFRFMGEMGESSA